MVGAALACETAPRAHAPVCLQPQAFPKGRGGRRWLDGAVVGVFSWFFRVAPGPHCMRGRLEASGVQKCSRNGSLSREFAGFVNFNSMSYLWLVGTESAA